MKLDDGGGYNVGAEHDHVFIYATDRPLGDNDYQAMIELGWTQYEAEREDEYDPGASWLFLP